MTSTRAICPGKGQPAMVARPWGRVKPLWRMSAPKPDIARPKTSAGMPSAAPFRPFRPGGCQAEIFREFRGSQCSGGANFAKRPSM